MMAWRILKGVLVAVILGGVCYGSLLLGAFLAEATGNNVLAAIVSAPGFLYTSVGLPFVSLIDYLPMYLIFPGGGAPGVFGSILLFAVLVWSFLLSILSVKQIWPFKP